MYGFGESAAARGAHAQADELRLLWAENPGSALELRDAMQVGSARPPRPQPHAQRLQQASPREVGVSREFHSGR